jgi:hypothetical protein
MGCEWSFTWVCKLFDTTARFRWVVCQLDALRKCRTPAALEKAIRRLPKTLNETYDRILGAIDEDDRRDALSLLQWLAFSVRTLSTDEAVEVLATDPDSREGLLFDEPRRLRDSRDIYAPALSPLHSERAATPGMMTTWAAILGAVLTTMMLAYSSQKQERSDWHTFPCENI